MSVDLDIYHPFDEGAGSDAEEDRWYLMARLWRATGIVAKIVGDEFEVYADSSGMLVKVKTGAVWIMGGYGQSTGEKTLAIGAADATNPRIDRVVARLHLTSNKVLLDVLAGTAAASPSAPALTQGAAVWEVSLAQVYVPASATTITQYDIVDERVFDFDDLIGGGRLSLVRGDGEPVADVDPEAPTSTDTGTDTVTYTTLPPWAVTGEAVQVSATGGGLTAGVTYYIRVSGTSFSFHTTLRDALANANLVNLTGNVQPNTVYPARVYLTGGANAQISGTVVGLASSTQFDVFVYLNDGVPALSVAAWTGSEPDIALVRGSYRKSSDNDYYWIGSIETDASGVVIDAEYHRGVINFVNPVWRKIYKDGSGMLSSTSATFAQVAAAWTVYFLQPHKRNMVELNAHGIVYVSASGTLAEIGIGVDSAVSSEADVNEFSQSVNEEVPAQAVYEGQEVGSHYATVVGRRASGTGTATVKGVSGRNAFIGKIYG